MYHIKTRVVVSTRHQLTSSFKQKGFVNPAFQDTSSVALADASFISKDMPLLLHWIGCCWNGAQLTKAIQITLCLSCPVLNVIYLSSNFCAVDPRTLPPAEITELEPVYSESRKGSTGKPLILFLQALSTKLVACAKTYHPKLPSYGGGEPFSFFHQSANVQSQVSLNTAWYCKYVCRLMFACQLFFLEESTATIIFNFFKELLLLIYSPL